MRLFSIFSLAAWMVIAALPVRPARAQDSESAKQFLESLYRHYANRGPGLDLSGPKARKYFDASLDDLLDADAFAVGPDEVGVLDGDPVCSCQDWDGIWDLKIAVQILKDGRAQAAVSFALFPPEAKKDRSLRSLEITLAREDGQWRIDNILDKSDPNAPFDLRAELQKEIRASQHKAQTKAGRP